MTADSMFNRVLALMFSDESEKNEMTNSFLAVLNILLLENFEAENGIRGEKDALPEPPVIAKLSDEIPYSGRILAFLPYGLAGTLMAEDDVNIAVQYKNKYESEKQKCVTARFREAKDSYGVCE